VICIGVGDDDAGDARPVAEAHRLEHTQDVRVIDAVAGVHHHLLGVCPFEEEDVPSAGHLEAVEGGIRTDIDALHIAVKPLTRGGFEGGPGLEDIVEHLVRILTEVGQLLDGCG